VEQSTTCLCSPALLLESSEVSTFFILNVSGFYDFIYTDEIKGSAPAARQSGTSHWPAQRDCSRLFIGAHDLA
jgi:hypothetical protein